ncbi:MAG: HEAT repeat domain-containing protein [Ginsengibacter sp.]
MRFYDLDKIERQAMVEKINKEIYTDLKNKKRNHLLKYFSDEDTYIRKTAYLSIGRLYKTYEETHSIILKLLDELDNSKDEKVRQTVTNAAGEIGILHFAPIAYFMEKGLFDEHHSVRNAVIGSLKKMGEKNPKPVLAFAKKYLHHPDKEIRREICHGIELRGRKHPEDILPLLKELQDDATARVKNTLLHVLGQISYKKGCLEKVIVHLKTWHNDDLIQRAIKEILDVHDRYKNFSELTRDEAREYIDTHF